MLEKQKEKYRGYILRLAQGLDVSDPVARSSIYVRLEKANEDMIAKNGAAFGEEHTDMLRSALAEAIAEYEAGFTPPPRTEPAAEVHEDARNEQAHDPTIHDAATTVVHAHGPEADFDHGEEVEPREEARSEAPVAITPAMRDGTRGRNALMLGLAIGAVAVCAGLYALTATGMASVSLDSQKIARSNYVESAFSKQEAQVQVARDYLGKVRDSVIKMQKGDPAKLTKSAGAKAIPLAALDKTLAGGLPKSLPKGTSVLVRANAKGYKVLLNSPLCSTVELADLALVDPVRKRVGLGCSYFGMWNADGAKL